jgi:hypothetical protein
MAEHRNEGEERCNDDVIRRARRWKDHQGGMWVQMGLTHSVAIIHCKRRSDRTRDNEWSVGVGCGEFVEAEESGSHIP